MNSYQKRLQEIYMLENQVEDLDFTIMQLAEDNRKLRREKKIWVIVGAGIMGITAMAGAILDALVLS